MHIFLEDFFFFVSSVYYLSTASDIDNTCKETKCYQLWHIHCNGWSRVQGVLEYMTGSVLIGSVNSVYSFLIGGKEPWPRAYFQFCPIRYGQFSKQQNEMISSVHLAFFCPEQTTLAFS